jgi:hypothetical protein
MKIIGKTDEGFLLSATEDELAHLLGFNSSYSVEDRTKRLAPGQRIKVADLYKRLEKLGKLPKELADTAKALRGIADAIDAFEPVLVEAASTKDLPNAVQEKA